MSESADSLMTWNESRDAEAYQHISKLALFALLAALVSLSAFSSPALWLVPPLGVVIALAAMFRVGRNEQLAGMRIAGLGLLISSFALTAAPTLHLTKR